MGKPLELWGRGKRSEVYVPGRRFVNLFSRHGILSDRWHTRSEVYSPGQRDVSLRGDRCLQTWRYRRQWRVYRYYCLCGRLGCEWLNSFLRYRRVCNHYNKIHCNTKCTTIILSIYYMYYCYSWAVLRIMVLKIPFSIRWKCHNRNKFSALCNV